MSVDDLEPDDPAAPFRAIAEQAEEDGEDEWAALNRYLADQMEDK